MNLTSELRGLVGMRGGPPGAIVVVQRAGQRRVYTAGASRLGSKRPIRVSDRMRLASTAKAFSGAVALSLVAAHKLSLDDTIAKLLPQLPAAWGKVTLRQALNHTSGLPDLTSNRSLIEYATKHPRGKPSPMFLLHFLAHDSLAFRPGSRYEYSNTDNFVVALMAQAATHRSYTALLRSQVYRPLELRHTSLPRGAPLPAPYLHGYQPDPPRPPENVSTLLSAAHAWASGGLVSTPADLNRFIRGYAGARLFTRTAQARQLQFVAGNSEPIGPGTNSAGLGIFRYRTRCGTVYGHTGNTAGYTQFMASTLDGIRSVTASVSERITNRSTGPHLAAFRRLRRIETDAVCQALSRKPQLHPKRDAALTKSIRRALATASAPGAIGGVWQRGKAAYVRSFGVRDTATRRAMRPNVFMRIGSETKTFTVTAIPQLVDQGKISLDDPISKYVGGVISGDTITLRELAQMRSGLVNYTVTEPFDRSLTADPRQTWKPQQLLSYSIAGPLQFAPRTRLSYSNTNTIQLGLVVQKVSGQPIGDYIKRHITAPLGMTQTCFPTGASLPSPHAHGYADSTPGKKIADATNWNPTWAGGQMVSTLHDLRIGAPSLATGRGLICAATQRRRAASVAGSGDPITYGIGLFNVHQWTGHNGSLPGYQTLALYRPQTKTTIVALINTGIEHKGRAPSTLVGQAITKVISPKHVYTCPRRRRTTSDPGPAPPKARNTDMTAPRKQG